MTMNSFELMQARSYSESVLINILTDLGADVQFIIGHRREGGFGQIGFQAFWPEPRKTDWVEPRALGLTHD